MDLSLLLLGETEVRLNGKLLDNLSAEKAHALLFYLVVESQYAHRRDALAEMLWPEKPSGSGRNSLKQTLSLLRNALGDRDLKEPFLLSSNRDLQFNIGCSHQIDVREFKDLTKKVGSHPHTASIICEGCAELLERAVNLYRDDFLSDFYLIDSPEFNEWILSKRESYKRLMTNTLIKIISYYEEKGDYKTASGYGKKLIDLEPWSESNHRRQMALLAASGKRSAALKQYHRCEAMLQSEFGVKPTPETIRLYEEIKKWKVSESGETFHLREKVIESTQFSAEPALKTTRQLKSWVIGSAIISFIVLLGFIYIIWNNGEDPGTSSIFNSPNAPEEMIPATNQTGEKPQYTDQPAPEVQAYLRGNNPNLALAFIYDKTRGSDWIQNDGWLEDSSPCEWFGITCQGNNIVELRLPNNNLEGRLPPEVGDISTLRVLDLSNNLLGGPIPPEIGYLNDLVSFYLEGNFEIKGEIPPEIGNLRKLEELVLSSASGGGSLLSGELPIEFGDLIKLDKLIIEDTLIHGPIPSQLGNCLQLSVLSLSQNNLSGPIPGELYNLSKLRSLDLWANQTLSGPISSKIGQLKHLDFLNLSHNNFSGNLPDELGTLSNLDWVGLQDNTFEGALPSSMTQLNLSVLHIENTSICEPADAVFQAWFDTINDLSPSRVPCRDKSTDSDDSTLSGAENDPYVIHPNQDCMPGERLLYLEDFQDGKAQGWPEIEYKAQNWEIVSDQNDSGNLLVQNPGIIGSMIFYTEKYFGDGVYRIDFMRIGDPQPIFVWHSNTEPFESEIGTITDSDYSIGFMHHGAHFVRYTFPVQDTTLLDNQIEVTTDIWHKIEISTFDGLLQVWLDGEKLLAYQDPKPLPEGTIAMGLEDSMVEDSMVYYDNLLVCELTAPFESAYPADQ